MVEWMAWVDEVIANIITFFSSELKVSKTYYSSVFFCFAAAAAGAAKAATMIMDS